MRSHIKQEAHGPHRSPEKIVQIIKKIWLYHYVASENKEKEEDENVKSLQTDDGWQVIRKAHLSFQLRWANKQSDTINKNHNSHAMMNYIVI